MTKPGKYYADAILARGDRRYARRAATAVKTASAARSLVERTIAGSPEANGRAHLLRWNEKEQRKDLVAERDEAGNWWHFDLATRILTAWDVD